MTVTNSPQSSRVAGSYQKSLFTNLGIKQISKPAYFAEKTIGDPGLTDVQIKEKTKANPLHYLVLAAIVVGVVYLVGRKLDNHENHL